MPPAPGLPIRAGAVLAKAGELPPGEAGVGGAEEGGVFGTGEDGIGAGEGGLQVPDALELPRVRRAVVPLVGSGVAGVAELIANGCPREAAVVRALGRPGRTSRRFVRRRCGWDLPASL